MDTDLFTYIYIYTYSYTEFPSTAQATTQAEQAIELTDSTSEAIWQRARAHLSGIIQANAQQYCALEVAGSNQLRIMFSEEYNICKSVCERPEHARKITEAVSAVVGTPVRVEFGIEQAAAGEKPVVPRATQRQETRIAVAENKLMRRAQELFGARPTGIDRPQQ